MRWRWVGFLVSSTCWVALMLLGFEPQTCFVHMNYHAESPSSHSEAVTLGLVWDALICVWGRVVRNVVYPDAITVIEFWASSACGSPCLPYSPDLSIFHAFSLPFLYLYALCHDLRCLLANDKKTTRLTLGWHFYFSWNDLTTGPFAGCQDIDIDHSQIDVPIRVFQIVPTGLSRTENADHFGTCDKRNHTLTHIKWVHFLFLYLFFPSQMSSSALDEAIYCLMREPLETQECLALHVVKVSYAMYNTIQIENAHYFAPWRKSIDKATLDI